MPLALKYWLGGLINPLTLALLAVALLACLSRRWPTVSRRLSLGIILLLWSISTPLVATTTNLSLEGKHPPLPMAKIAPADVIIILGGAVFGATSPRLEVELTDASDRVLHAFRLFQAGKAPVILISAGGKPLPEAKSIATLLQAWGTPHTSLLLEERSLNTRENALESKKIMDQHNMRRGILVTSALHMPRALATFRAAGVDVTPATTDVNAIPGHEPLLLRCLPNPGAMSGVMAAMREWAAIWLYHQRGWIRSHHAPEPGHISSIRLRSNRWPT
ncbi:MAG: YdcF family protein [Magnetococcales bacterium]|nr:YdcF family protein [Magnetococcales bacterium]